MGVIIGIELLYRLLISIVVSMDIMHSNCLTFASSSQLRISQKSDHRDNFTLSGALL